MANPHLTPHAIDEGTIKFNAQWHRQPLSLPVPLELMACRDEIHRLKLIGYNQESGIGYGNISIRTDRGILISGTQTGQIYPIQADHFTLITAYDLAQNQVVCHGPVNGSSESMTHGVIYDAHPAIGAIIHGHNLTLWHTLRDRVPTSNPDVAYGTPAMGQEILRLFKQTAVMEQKVIVMAGHEAGIIFFGQDLQEAKSTVLTHYGLTREQVTTQ
ncbi:MAG: class II aldolase/adducin family protein [Synechococcaceae cyanobacterium RL_1_2]|nr:class II aldolase/adducin family protein [Synechococcaceae cyanobacterium RL_1_2]